jgi:hypothetical protein
MAIAGDVRLERPGDGEAADHVQSEVTRRLSAVRSSSSLDCGPGSRDRRGRFAREGRRERRPARRRHELGIIGVLSGRPAGSPETSSCAAIRRVARCGRVIERCVGSGAEPAHSCRWLVRPHAPHGRRSVADEPRRTVNGGASASTAGCSPNPALAAADDAARHPDRCRAAWHSQLGADRSGGSRAAATLQGKVEICQPAPDL